VGVVAEPGPAHPGHPVVGGEPCGDGAGVGDVGGHAQRQRLEPAQQEEGVEGRQAGAHVAHLLGPQPGAEGVLAEVVPPAQPVVARHRLGEAREPPRPPVEATGLGDHPGDGGAVPAQELRGRVHDDVGPELQGPAEVRGGERRVHDQRQAVRPGDLGEAAQVGDLARRVGDDLGEQQLGPVADGGGEVVGVAAADERRVDAESAQRHVELHVGAAVQPGGRDDVIAGAGQGREGEELGRLSAGGGHRPDAALQVRHPFLEHVDGGVRDPRVDGAVLLEGEQVGRIGGVLEHEGRAVVDRRGPRPDPRIGPPTRMQSPRAKTPIPIRHADRSPSTGGILVSTSDAGAIASVMPATLAVSAMGAAVHKAFELAAL